MDLDLSDDQVALRDGIAALLGGRFGIERVRAGFDRAMFDELADAGVFSLPADGFSWADCAVVFEQLGRFCVPGPLVASLLLGGGRVVGCGRRPDPAADRWVEHLDVLEYLLVARRARSCSRRSRGADRCRASSWPLDPLTPVAAIDALPAGDGRRAPTYRMVRGAGARSPRRCNSASPIAAPSSRSTYAKERVQFDRPIGGVPGDQASAAPTCSCAPRWPGPRCTRPARSSTSPASRATDRGISRRQGAGR